MKIKKSWEDYRDENLHDLVNDKMLALPDFYKSSDGVARYTNMEDALSSITQDEAVSIARALRDKEFALAGGLLYSALWRICYKEAEYELMEKYEAGQPDYDALEEAADIYYQRRRDDKLTGDV